MDKYDGMILPLLYEAKELWENDHKPFHLGIETLAPAARELLTTGLTLEDVQEVLFFAMLKLARMEDSASATRSRLRLIPK